MKRTLTSAAAAAVAALALLAAPSAARADTGYHPSDADFADCPALPANAVAGTWTCYAMTALSGTIQLNQEGTVIDRPLRVTTAQGRTNLGVTTAVWGGLANAGPFPLSYGLIGTAFTTPDPHSWQVTFDGTGDVKAGLIVPFQFGLKASITGGDLTTPCTIGGEAEPVTVKTNLNWFYPASIDGVGLTKVGADAIFGMPSAESCGVANILLVNAFVGLPAPATADKLSATWALRSKKY